MVLQWKSCVDLETGGLSQDNKPLPEPAGIADPVLMAIDAMVQAAAIPLGVFDAAGVCLSANPAYRSLETDQLAAGEQRASFSPEGVRDWVLVWRSEHEEANRAKAGFFAAMSHELRTPLNAVIGFAEIMHRQILGPVGVPEYAEYAGHILHSGQHLLLLINDILDYARIESDGLRLNIRAVDMRDVARATLEVLIPTAQSGQVALTGEMPEQPVMIHGDEQRLRQALLNIAGNAVKFTRPGGSVVMTLRQAADGGAEISVIDSGIGISQANISNVFEPFWQADSGLDRVREGAGIGLSLTRQLVEMHGGSLDVQSRLGEGTLVVMVLPPGNPPPPES